MMQKDGEYPRFNYQEPETQQDEHRPKGSPRPRENKSQKAQNNSAPQQGIRGQE